MQTTNLELATNANHWHTLWMGWDASNKSAETTRKFSADVAKHTPDFKLILDGKGVWWVKCSRGVFEANSRADALRMAKDFGVQAHIFWNAPKRMWEPFNE